MKLSDAVGRMREADPSWAKTLLLAGYRGSDAHGTKLPPDHDMATDDVDVFGVCVQRPEWYLGLQALGNARQTWDKSGDHFDPLIHDVRKFFALLCKGNPNVHCWLWTETEDRMPVSDVGEKIIKRRRVFLSRRCFDALHGYAYSQIARMEKEVYRGYMGEKRKKLADRFGYDVKHAAHSIRLLNMGIELARTGEMHTRRPPDEAETLKDIKAGLWPYDDVRSLATTLKAQFAEAEAGSELPREPHYDAVNDLLVSVIAEAA